MANTKGTEIRVLLFSSDLMLISSVSGAAAALGFFFRSVSSIEDLVAKATPATVLCVDLAFAPVDATKISEQLPMLTARSGIAFGPHVHTAKLDQAREAGFAKVMSRGQFVGRMIDELKTAAAIYLP
ncbi:MAG: hypothetical protein U0936_09345 [Planctomycetaceae bacterium]